MKVFAPGKVVLTGAYAVLDGAPSIVMATSRGATADGNRIALSPTIEVRAALGDGPAPHADASALYVGARKLGLGASAAILVASLGAREAERGVDIGDPKTREGLLERARAAHATAQGGGSGVDVAASLYGGVLRYRMGGVPQRVALPLGAVVRVFACGTSARTSELRAAVTRLSSEAPLVYARIMGSLHEIASRADAAVQAGQAQALIEAVADASVSLGELGEATSTPIVPLGWAGLASEAVAEGAAFCVGGAGGGDVAVYVGPGAPSIAFSSSARALGLFSLDVELDEKGVRVVSGASTSVDAHAVASTGT